MGLFLTKEIRTKVLTLELHQFMSQIDAMELTTPTLSVLNT
jgi:hypothetical protein